MRHENIASNLKLRVYWIGLTYRGQAWRIEDRSIKDIQIEGQGEKKMERAEQSIRDEWNTDDLIYMNLQSQKDKRENEAEAIYEERIAERIF